MIGRSHSARLTALFALFVLGGGALLGRLFYLQGVSHGKYVLLAEELHRRITRLPPRRGRILDAGGGVLAMSVESPSLAVDPSLIADPRLTAVSLGRVLGLSPDPLEEKLRAGGRYLRVKRHLSETEEAAASALALAGVWIEKEMKRVYTRGRFLGTVLGHADLDGEGREGLELFFNDRLKGRPGWRVTEKDSRQREAFWLRHPGLDPVEGVNLVLTVDEVIQEIAEEELESAVTENNALGGTILVMDPQSGDVLAMANHPDYDPNGYSVVLADQRRNRAVADILEPGSTFKVFPGSAVLEAGMVDLDTEFDCENGIFRTARFTLHDHDRYGILTFAEIIQYSSNIGMAKVGMLISGEAMYQGLGAFGFCGRTGIDLPGEVSCRLTPPRSWSGSSLSRITMGHEVAVTPISLLSAYCSLGNGGILLRPRLVDRIEKTNGEVVQRYPVEERGRSVSASTAAKMLRVMRTVVDAEGTGRLAAVPGYDVAGKTGTAQKIDPDGTYSHKRFVALFIGLFPAAAPRAAILVVVDEPHPQYYGGVVAAPAFRKVAEKVIQRLGLAPSEPELFL
jgi:cell division protein FtsI (penicillin-binding protein 3)